MARPTAPIGAHISAAGGLSRVCARIEAVSAEAAQIFVANPRAWATRVVSAEDDAEFRSSCTVPVYVHAPYLINLGSPSPETLRRSCEALEFSLRRASEIDAVGVVVHAGSAVLGNRREDALTQAREAILRALDAVPSSPALLIEPTAGGGGALASDADSTAEYVAQFDGDERVGLCLDTCHMHAAGHDLATLDGFLATLRAFRSAGRIGLVHVNDSRDPAGSKRDRHEAIGRGTIGRDAFAALFGSPALRRVPMIVETADADHATDIATLKQLRASRVVRPSRLPAAL